MTAMGAKLLKILALAVAVHHSRCRQRAIQTQLAIVKDRMDKRARNAVAIMIALAPMSDQDQEKGPRRVVPRCLGKWRGSTIFGYLRGGPAGRDEVTYRENFRMSIGAFDKLVELMEGTPFRAQLPSEPITVLREKARSRRGKRPANLKLASAALDYPTTRFKVAACLYTMGQGGPKKPNADACGIGKSTLSRWLSAFAEATFTHLKPICMPSTPWGPAELNAVQGNFASRRGIPHVAMACDGSHIPFRPRCKKEHAVQYRNYKGWTSILAVAFVDSYHRFFDLDVGSPGKAGDNTVLKHNWLMEAIKEDPDKWLGKNGVILGDSGASDADGFFLNPYHAPSAPERCWFNFCHSSTRFYVEETFGRWKNKWRFLMNPLNVDHKLQTQLIYASAILHNYCIMHGRDGDHAHFQNERHGSSACHEKFLGKYTAHMCPTCMRRGVQHCIHQASYRNGNAQTANARRAPSIIRDKLCTELWQRVVGNDPMAMNANLGLGDEDLAAASACGDGEAQCVRKIMNERASMAGEAQFHARVV